MTFSWNDNLLKKNKHAISWQNSYTIIIIVFIIIIIIIIISIHFITCVTYNTV